MNPVKILSQYPNLPRKLLVSFALYCANDVKHLLTDDRSLKALEVTELWLKGKATDEEVKVAVDAAHVIPYDNDNACNAATAAYYTAGTINFDIAIHAVYVVSYSAITTFPRSKIKQKTFQYTDKLLEMINELSETEKELSL